MPSADDLIRRIRLSDHVKKNGKVHHRAFRFDKDDEGHGISLTACETVIASDADLEAYDQSECVVSIGILGRCFLKKPQLLAEGLQIKEDKVAGPYGHLHRLLQDPGEENLCPGELIRHQLARLATENGSVKPFIPNPVSAA